MSHLSQQAKIIPSYLHKLHIGINSNNIAELISGNSSQANPTTQASHSTWCHCGKRSFEIQSGQQEHLDGDANSVSSHISDLVQMWTWSDWQTVHFLRFCALLTFQHQMAAAVTLSSLMVQEMRMGSNICSRTLCWQRLPWIMLQPNIAELH